MKTHLKSSIQYIVAVCIGAGVLTSAVPAIGNPLKLRLKLGPMADYGATPWYSEAVIFDNNKLKFALDTGANFTWVTSDLCTTSACQAHSRIDTTSSTFTWVDRSLQYHSFGPWGAMVTKTGKAPAKIADAEAIDIQLFASKFYKGAKFQTLAWDGGIGFPSESSEVAKGSGFPFLDLLTNKIVANPVVSFYTDRPSKSGEVVLGGDNPVHYDASRAAKLTPTKTRVKYLWGTELHRFEIGGQSLPPLAGKTFFLDTGSSHFKGDRDYIKPILDKFVNLKDAIGNPVFSRTLDGQGNWIGLYYTDGPAHSYDNLLPDVTVVIGQKCGGQNGVVAVTLRPDQYSYLIEQGDRSGKWALAFQILDGVGGLLVGSTFMDLVYTTFSYKSDAGTLSQDVMKIYPKKRGEQPKTFECLNS